MLAVMCGWISNHALSMPDNYRCEFGNFRRKIYSNISGNLLITYVSQLFPSSALQVMQQNKHVLDKQLSSSLCFNFVHYVQKRLFVAAWFPGVLANSNKNYIGYNFPVIASISGNIKFPENLQPY